MIKKILKQVALLLFYVVLILISLEISFRLLGYKPFTPKKIVGRFKTIDLDPDLGWKLRPGHYEIGPYNDIGDSMSITIQKGTGRITRPKSLEVGEKQVTCIGGSFTMGHILDDDETAVWKLQRRFPSFDFRNLAVGAYGGLQSLIVLEREIADGNRPICVIYGAIQHHELRNVAQGNWLMARRKKIPYATLKNDSTFEKKGLVGAYKFPFSDQLTSTFMIEKAVNQVFSFKRVKDARQLSYLIIRDMQRLCKENQISFYVAPMLFSAQGMKELVSFLEANDIQYIDCNVPLTKENTIKDNTHPNESVNDIWVERIAKQLLADGIVE